MHTKRHTSADHLLYISVRFPSHSFGGAHLHGLKQRKKFLLRVVRRALFTGRDLTYVDRLSGTVKRSVRDRFSRAPVRLRNLRQTSADLADPDGHYSLAHMPGKPAERLGLIRDPRHILLRSAGSEQDDISLMGKEPCVPLIGQMFLSESAHRLCQKDRADPLRKLRRAGMDHYHRVHGTLHLDLIVREKPRQIRFRHIPFHQRRVKVFLQERQTFHIVVPKLLHIPLFVHLPVKGLFDLLEDPAQLIRVHGL